jgi:Holliday junction DNA helicase RuvA
MYAYLKGLLAENKPTYAVIDVSGVGYKVFIPPNALNLSVGEKCKLYTSLVIRENAHTLYGFLEENARDLFEVLISISGIGPKTALCLLSRFDPESLYRAVKEKNIHLISTVPGIGKKTAERLVFDIGEKLTKISIESPNSSNTSHQHVQDALQALMNLGFSQNQAKNAVEKVLQNQSEPLELSQMITRALQQT